MDNCTSSVNICYTLLEVLCKLLHMQKLKSINNRSPSRARIHSCFSHTWSISRRQSFGLCWKFTSLASRHTAIAGHILDFLYCIQLKVSPSNCLKRQGRSFWEYVVEINFRPEKNLLSTMLNWGSR